MADLGFTIENFAAWLAQGRPHDVKPFRRALKLLIPALNTHLRHPAAMPDNEFMSRAPAGVLLDCLTPDGKRWAPWLIEAAPHLPERDWRGFHRRTFRRCLRVGSEASTL